jgi:murein DD-endopeptidase MepM/ murein hydrolase activator NlpD
MRSTEPKDHPYGIHVRIRHRDGYRTVYGHMARALVSPGEEVREGQVIGKADSTGASAGAHLHLTLKRDGATARGETSYPKDIIDPTPFMVWPENRIRKSAKAASWAAEHCLLGVCGQTGGHCWTSFAAIRQRLAPLLPSKPATAAPGCAPFTLACWSP